MRSGADETSAWAASAPLRADLAGGTIDLWPLYLFHPGACTVNLALSLRAQARFEAGGDRWLLETVDRRRRREVAPDDVIGAWRRVGTGSPFALPLAALAHFRPPRPGHLLTRVDGPPGGGLSGSSALLIACCGLLGRLAGRAHPRRTLHELARDLEVSILGVPTGVQDYFPAVYGGAQALVWGPGGVERRRLEVDLHELERRLILAYSGIAHDSGSTNWKLYRRRIEGDRESRAGFSSIGAAGEAAHRALAEGDWPGLAKAMNDDWLARQRLDAAVAPAALRRLEAAGRAAGATAAKGCGAAGGGCMLFLVASDTVRASVEVALRGAGAELVDLRVARSGLRVWRPGG